MVWCDVGHLNPTTLYTQLAELHCNSAGQNPDDQVQQIAAILIYHGEYYQWRNYQLILDFLGLLTKRCVAG